MDKTAHEQTPAIVTRLLQGDRRALARIVTLIENDAPRVQEYLATLYQHSGRAHIVGITGAPGAGKSTLVTKVVRELRQREQKVGIIAVDPTSPYTGGAILGDRIRMMELSGDPNVFIRSMASRGNLGGLASSTRDVIRAMDAAGYDPIIVETVGTGQAEVEVMRSAQTVVVVVAPGMGDDIQAIKAGILEIADIFVVSKADKVGADQAVAELAMLLSLDARRREARWRIPIVKTSAIKLQGIVQLVDALQSHRISLHETGQLAERTDTQLRNEIQLLVLQTIQRTLRENISEEDWQAILHTIGDHERDPYGVAREIVHKIAAYL